MACIKGVNYRIDNYYIQMDNAAKIEKAYRLGIKAATPDMLHYLCWNCLWFGAENQLVNDKKSGISSCPNCGFDELLEESTDE